MIFYVIGIVLWVIFVKKYVFYVGYCSTTEKQLAVIWFLIALVSAYLVLSVSSATLGTIIPSKQTEISREKIYSIQDNLTQQGSFVLGSGQIDTSLSYFYTVKNEKGAKIESVSSKITYIQESSEDPVIVKYNPEFENKWFLLISSPKYLDKECILTVPEKTVVQEYNINSQSN